MTQTARNGTALRKALVTQYGLTSAAALALVDVAAQALDQALRAERKLAKEGDCIGGARGLRQSGRPGPAAIVRCC